MVPTSQTVLSDEHGVVVDAPCIALSLAEAMTSEATVSHCGHLVC